MKNLLALLAASTYAQDDDTIVVTLKASDGNVKKGDSAVFTCSWTLNDEYNDYGEDNFQMYWKYELPDDGEVQSVASYKPDSEIVYYYNNNLADRVVLTPSFADRNASMTISNVGIADDDMEIVCEVHWNRRYSDGRNAINVYVDADLVELDELDASLEGRTQEDVNGTVTEPEDTEVAECTVNGIYPLPEVVTFRVGDEDIAVDIEEDDVIINSDGTYTVSGVLVLPPNGQYNGDMVTCVSIAAEDADMQEAETNQTFTLEVFYYTDEVTLTISGEAEKISDDEYSVVENNVYTVGCTANGNPPANIVITNHEGAELSNGATTVAVRALSDSIQHITCNAENNEEDTDFAQGEVQTDEAELDVYYISDVDLGDDVTGEYDTNYRKDCNVEGHPTPKVQWTKGDSNDIINDGDLDLGTLSYGDAGVYTCTATNAAGSESDSFELEVNGPCIVDINLVNAGQSALVPGQASLQMKCSVQGSDCNIEWDAPNLENFVQNGKIAYENGVSELFFDSFETFAEPTEFTCTATNEKGSQVDSIVIDEDRLPACCQAANSAGLGTGAIVGIVIAIPAILIIIGAAVFFCRKRNDDKNECVDEGDDATEPEKEPLQADHDGEGGNAEDDAV